MSFTLAALAELVHGTLAGQPEQVITGANNLEQAGPGELSFLMDDSMLPRLEGCRASALCVASNHVAAVQAKRPELGLIIVAEPQTAFVTLLQRLRPPRSRPAAGISPHAVISPSARIGSEVYIGPGAVIGDEAVIGDRCEIHPGVIVGAGCTIAEETILYPNCVLYHDVRIGKRVIVHAGAIIGADGFGYRFAGGRFHKIPQLGIVELADDVEIGACATIDRAAIDVTSIGEGTKIDNLVMIAHNCRIGKHNALASQVGIAGSCETGDYVRMGGQVGIRDHVKMNTGCNLGAKSGIHKDIPAGETWVGYPATKETEQMQLQMSLKRLPDMRDELRALRKQVATLVARLETLEGGPRIADQDQEQVA